MKSKHEIATEGFQAFLKKCHSLGVDNESIVAAMRGVLGEIESHRTFDVAPTKEVFTLPHTHVAVNETDYQEALGLLKVIASTAVLGAEIHSMVARFEGSEITSFEFPNYSTPVILTESEQKAILTNPITISALMDYHDEQQAHSDSVGAQTTGNKVRFEELKQIGFNIILQDPDIWEKSLHKDFGLEEE
jgi:hypothetical protein